jgi:hypothetical protein
VADLGLFEQMPVNQSKQSNMSGNSPSGFLLILLDRNVY